MGYKPWITKEMLAKKETPMKKTVKFEDMALMGGHVYALDDEGRIWYLSKSTHSGIKDWKWELISITSSTILCCHHWTLSLLISEILTSP